jgi:hypothetical protein
VFARSRLVCTVQYAKDDAPGELLFSPDGSMLATSRFGEVEMFGVATCKKRWGAKTPNRSPSLAFAPDGNVLACGDERVTLRDASTGTTLRTLDLAYGGSARALAFSKDGRGLAAALPWGVLLLGVENGERVFLALGATFSPEGSIAAPSGALFLRLGDDLTRATVVPMAKTNAEWPRERVVPDLAMRLLREDDAHAP